MLPPRKELFLYRYVRRKAVLSWPIEGAQPALPDLLQFETEAQSGHLTGNDFDVRAMHSNGSRWLQDFAKRQNRWATFSHHFGVIVC